MSFRDAFGAHLPYLRRYARALTGSQTRGDAAVRSVLEQLIADPDQIDVNASGRVELFRLFHALYDADGVGGANDNGLVQQLPMRKRQALLLTAVERFNTEDAAKILSVTPEDMRADIAEAKEVLASALKARVLIIEDEPIIAMHIRSIVEQLGHEPTGIVRTHREAVEHATNDKPELVLADISLADGSSGIDAVTDILATQSVPVIFITAFPERLLTGERPEPAYLITKPFEAETVMATIGQALLVHRELHAEQTVT